jgi:hypothetical protein
MTPFFDFVYRDRQCSAPTDVDRDFLSIHVESLDAPKVMPAGSTKGNFSWDSGSPFHVTSTTYRRGA